MSDTCKRCKRQISFNYHWMMVDERCSWSCQNCGCDHNMKCEWSSEEVMTMTHFTVDRCNHTTRTIKQFNDMKNKWVEVKDPEFEVKAE